VTVTFLVAAAASWINWGFGLVIGAVLAREVAKQIRVDFAWLVAAAYSGFVIYASGPSGSIPLSQASAGNVLNIVEKITGHIVPFSESIFSVFNVVPTLLILAVMPFVLVMVRPRADEMQVFVPPAESIAQAPERKTTTLFARRIERSAVGSLFLVAAGVGYVVVAWRSGQLTVDINLVIFLFLIAGLALHGSPLNYGDAVKNAAKQTGSMMLQYPIYGGIMGIMTATGLAEEISRSIATSASAATLPVSVSCRRSSSRWSYRAVVVIGQCRGPSPSAAVALSASIPATTMAVAMGEESPAYPAFLGVAGGGHRRHRHPARDGIYGAYLHREHARLRRGIVVAGLTVGGDNP
jgi:short-chain fatty acids transporter